MPLSASLQCGMRCFSDFLVRLARESRKMLHLVGESIDKHRASYGVEHGRLVPVMRGVLVEAGDDADAVILNHAIRIARYLYPQVYLSGYSAEKLSPTIDGRLFLSGKQAEGVESARRLISGIPTDILGGKSDSRLG